jgi:hypothetical protein
MWKQEIHKFLETNKIAFESIQNQSVFELLFFPQHQLFLHLIDIQSFQNYSPPNTYFQFLSDLYNAKNQRIIHLWEDVYTLKQDLVDARILAMTGTFTRLHARHCIIKRIDKPTADNFLKINHLQDTVTAKFKYGLFLKPQYVERFMGDVVCGDTNNGTEPNEPKLIAVATFSGGRTMKVGERAGKRSYELIRFASLQRFVVMGGMDKLLKKFTEEHDPDDIMSYADRDWSDGRSYNKLGFAKIENSLPQIFYINPRTLERKSINEANFFKAFNAGSLKFIKTITKKSPVEATEDFVIEFF